MCAFLHIHYCETIFTNRRRVDREQRGYKIILGFIKRGGSLIIGITKINSTNSRKVLFLSLSLIGYNHDNLVYNICGSGHNSLDIAVKVFAWINLITDTVYCH
jgi:hypothetical protein